MKFIIEYHEEIKKDIKKLKLSKSQMSGLKKKIENISCNPYSKKQGGLGESLKGSLKGLLKFRFDNDYRVVYKIVNKDSTMKIIVVGLRTDKIVYKLAYKRENKNKKMKS